MHILTKEGKVIEGEPLTADQLEAHAKLPDIIGDCSGVYIALRDREVLTLHLMAHLDIKVRPEPVVEDPEFIALPEDELPEVPPISDISF